MASLKDIKANIKVDTTDIPMSDEVKNEWVNDPLSKMLDKWKHSGPSEMRLINLEDKHMRILKGYSKEERKELEEAKDGGFSSTMTLIYGIGEDYGDCHALYEKYYREDTNDNNQMAKDIIDFYCGNAKFPEQKYYIKLPKLGFPYLVQAVDGMELVRYLRSGYKEEFTEQEIKDIDPRYMAFAVPVEEDDE